MPQGCCRLRCSANERRLRAPDGEVCASPAGCVCASVCSFGPGGHCATRRVELAWKVGTTRVEQERAWRGRRGGEGEEDGYAAEAERGSGSRDRETSKKRGKKRGKASTPPPKWRGRPPGCHPWTGIAMALPLILLPAQKLPPLTRGCPGPREAPGGPFFCLPSPPRSCREHVG